MSNVTFTLMAELMGLMGVKIDSRASPAAMTLGRLSISWPHVPVIAPDRSDHFQGRYNECDPMGVAHHATYPVWFEMGRTELLRQRGMNYRDLEDQGVHLAVVALEVRYKRPARYDDALTLRTILIKAGHVKIEHAYELLRDSVLLATAATTLACLDGDGRLRALPGVLVDQER